MHCVLLDMDAGTSAPHAQTRHRRIEHLRFLSGRERSATRRRRNELFDQIDLVRIDETFYEVSETPLESNEVTVTRCESISTPADSTAKSV